MFNRKTRCTLLAAFAVLCAAVASPYLIPENPDSPIFRSGVWTALLLTAAFFPVREALERADRRTLICGFAFGLLFCGALSLGSELFVYERLLPGLGSAVRRVAVPMLAAPLVGCLSARVMLFRLPVSPSKRHIPTPVFALCMMLSWLPVLLAYFPGILNYDVAGELDQLVTGQYNDAHPLLYSLLQNGLILVGETLCNRTFGMLLTTVARMLCLSFALAYGLSFAQKRGAPPAVLLLFTALFALHPVFSVMAVSTSKDVPFAAALLVLTLLCWDMLQSPETVLRNKRRIAEFVLMTIFVSQLRKNGLFALIALFPGLIIALRGHRVQIAKICALAAGCSVLLSGILHATFSPIPMHSTQLMSLPAQQLVRAYNLGEISPEDADELEGWYLFPTGLNVYPHIADRAKNNLDSMRLRTEAADYLSLWARVGRDNPRIYMEAFLMLNIGFWYPDDLSHAGIYDPINYEKIGYLETVFVQGEDYGIDTDCFLPAVRDFIENICTQNAYQKIPLVSLFFSLATPLWVLVFAAAMLIARRRSRGLPALLGILGLFVSYLFGPCALARYALPMFCIAPILLIIALIGTPEKELAA